MDDQDGTRTDPGDRLDGSDRRQRRSDESLAESPGPAQRKRGEWPLESSGDAPEALIEPTVAAVGDDRFDRRGLGGGSGF
jgi:hypothetical protein